MKKIIPILSLISVISINCFCQTPKDFTYRFINQNTGLDSLIHIDGYYVTQRACDSAFLSVFMFYPNGLFTIATTSKILPELINCFEYGGKTKICKYPLWGTYRIMGDTIKTQSIRQEGIGICTIFRNYQIMPDRTLVNICDYIYPENTKIGNMKNYPSFFKNPCPVAATFVPLPSKRNQYECPLFSKKWFYEQNE